MPAILRAIVACGWFGIQTWIGALALQALLTAAWPAGRACPAAIWISFAIFWLVQVAIIIRGLEGIKMLESWSAPLLLGGGALLLWWAIDNGGGLGRILSEAPKLQQGSTPFWTLFPAALTANVGYWATLSLNIPDFTRYAQSQRSQALGQALGLPATMTAFAFHRRRGDERDDRDLRRGDLGSGRADRAHRQPDGRDLRRAGRSSPRRSRPTWPRTSCRRRTISRASRRRRSATSTGGLITAAIGIVMMPWKLYADAAAYIFTWLIGYSSLMGAIGGILIADYWMLRSRELSLPDLFKLDGRYSYSGGVNRKAMIALVVVDPAGRSRLRRAPR